jgi:hypothetical protein
MSELEHALRRLAPELEVPETPDLVERVLERLEPRRGRPWAGERRRWILAVAVALLALLGATLAIPDARSAFFRILNIGGERIVLVDELPEIEALEDLTAELFEMTLGERVTLEQARARIDFPLRELEKEPDRVYLGERGTVWFLYGTPEEVRLLVAQTPRVRLDAPAVLKKVSGEGTQIEEVSVDGARGIFLSGEPHFLFLLDERGQVVEAVPRLAQDVLVWDEGGVAYRLEGDFELDEALELARSLRVR